MIERFNFFDIYAYLLPGVAFICLMWLPFGIVSGHWPSADLASALFSLLAAYIVGHVLYFPAKAALPTGYKKNDLASRKGQQQADENDNTSATSPPAGTGHQSEKKDAPSAAEKLIHPSEYLLDVKDSTFPENFKKGLEKLINGRSQGEVTVDIHLDWNNTEKNVQEKESEQRVLAFLLCRSALVTRERGFLWPAVRGPVSVPGVSNGGFCSWFLLPHRLGPGALGSRVSVRGARSCPRRDRDRRRKQSSIDGDTKL